VFYESSEVRTGATVAVGRRLIEAVRLSPIPQYKIAFAAGIHPNTLSKLVCGIQRVRRGDPRVLAVAMLLGVPADDAFE
jgi:hypothetical protein